MEIHPDDQFHPAPDDDPFWTETFWFTFAVPERNLSGQLYPFFRPNQGVTSGGVFLWDESGSEIWNCRYSKNLWHLPIPRDQNLNDLSLASGHYYRCLEPLKKYELHYTDPDANEVEVHLTFEAICEPNRLAESHLDQPGRYRGQIRLRDEWIDVDAYGMRDRSWGARSQIGATLHPNSPNKRGGYSYATASDQDAWHAITADFGTGYVAIHGFLLRDGVWSKLAEGTREVISRDAHCPSAVRITGKDELGRDFEATGRMRNKIGVHLNPNLWTWNCLTEWTWGEGLKGFGEDHDNWSASAFRQFARGESEYAQ